MSRVIRRTAPRRGGAPPVPLWIPLLAVPCLATLGLATGARAAEPPHFEEKAEVVEVEVPVSAVDKDGKPIRGLTKDDFRVFDEGKQQEITDFQVVDLAVTAPDTTGAAERHAATPTEAREVPAAARRHFLLLFDLSFSRPSAILKARVAARKFILHRLAPSDLVAVATHSVESGTRLVVTFTPDRAQLARAIDTLGSPNLLAGTRLDPLRFLLDQPSGQAALSGLDSGSVSLPLRREDQVLDYLKVIGKAMEKSEKAYARGKIFAWADSLRELAGNLRSVEGRKYVVYFSEGFDGRLLLGRQPAAEDPATQEDLFNIQFGQSWMVDTDDMYGNTPLQGNVADMLAAFIKADCSIETVDISGLGADPAAASRVHHVGQDALFYVAHETGGRLFEDANNFDAELDDLLERTTVTYLLSFQPSAVIPDGSFHRIRIEADVPKGTALNFRRGYFAPRPYPELDPMEKSLLASDAIASAEPKHDLDLEVLAAPFRASDEMAYVPVIVEIGGAGLLADQPDDRLPVEIYAYVTDAHEEMKDFFTQLITLDLSHGRQAFAATGLKYYGHLDLPPGRYLVRVLVRNAVTGRTGVKTVPVEIPEYGLQRPTLLPPFFIESPGHWFLVREKQDDAYRTSVVYPFTVKGEPYIPAADPHLEPGEDARLCLVAYNLGDGSLKVDGRVLTPEGEPVSGGEVSLSERTTTGIAGVDKLLAVFRPAGLPKGRYTLQVAITDPASGWTGTGRVPFSVAQ